LLLAELYRLQIGLDPKNWKPMTSVGSGVREIRVAVGGQKAS
jgi:phage-related protein